MTGPEHYRQAEALLRGRPHPVYPGGYTSPTPEDVAEAQVHATLALAAATAFQPSRYAVGRPQIADWQAVAGHDEGPRRG